jgi:uncharacterized protein (TIGR02246 family)
MQTDAEAVRAVNSRFYQALSRQNLLEMEEVWSHAAHVRCVLPGSALLRGWDTIRQSWRSMFTSAICLTVDAEDAHVSVHGPTAVVTCRECITSFTLTGASRTATLATNVFEKHHGRWQLIVHHASRIEAERSDGASQGERS